MQSKNGNSRPPLGEGRSKQKLDEIVARARQARDQRERGYREQSLRIHPWVCARCGREFTRENLHELTVHHKDHDHDNNPPDGSNWENLCVYCHENEHARFVDAAPSSRADSGHGADTGATHNPFADLGRILKDSS